MKNLFKLIVPMAVAAIALTACNKEIEKEQVFAGETLTINVTSSLDPLVGADGTKTYINSSNTIIWGENESMKIGVLGDGDADKYTWATSTTSEYNGEESATFSFSVTPSTDPDHTGTTYTYVGLYPASAAVSSSNTNATSFKVKLNEVQNASEGAYDPASYILIAKHEDGKTAAAADWVASYRRATALNKLTLKGLTEDIVSVKIITPEGTAFAGSRRFNLVTDEFGDVYSEPAVNSIEVDYATALKGSSVDGVNQKVVWFNSWGIELTAGEEMTIIAKSATKSYTKTFAARSTGISFKQGYLNTLGVNMASVTGEDLAYDGCYAELVYSDVESKLSSSYGLVEVTKAHGDTWKMYACNSNNAIAVRRDDGDKNDSYIKLPDFSENIQTVVVTLQDVTASKAITLESSATATDGSIASLNTTDATVYTFDLSSKSVKTAYFRSNGAQAQVVKIEVIAGTDTRESLDNPENVGATLNADVANAINVEWDAVDDADAYLITLVPDSGDNVVIEVGNVTSYTVTGLLFEMEYLVAVQAIPADPYINKSSGQASASNTVTTGEEPAGDSWQLVASISGITAGDKYLLATNDKAHVYNGQVSSGHLQVVAVTAVNDKIADSDLPSSAAQIEFISAGSTNKYYLKVGDKYISATKASSGGFANNSTDPFEWTFSDASAGGMNAVGTTFAAYIRSYNNNSFRSYANTSNGATFYLYKFVGTGGSGEGGNEGGDPVEHTATISFGNNGTKINAASVTGSDSENNTWTISTVGTTSFTQQGDYSQVGSGSKPATSITFTTTLAKSATDIQLEGKFGGFSGTAGTVTLKVGESSIGTGSLNATSDVVVTSTSTGSGTVLTVTVTGISKGVKCYYLKATYTN